MSSLYTNLMSLCDRDDAFFFADRVLDDTTYRIFNYRLASYTDFLEPDALECRGIMFAMTDDVGIDLDEPRLVCRPMCKFFNLNENPMVMDLDVSPDTIDRMEIKADGSLISTFMHHGELRVKSKGSLASEQAIAAQSYIDQRPDLKAQLTRLTESNHTVNMELVAPYNRIVLNYQEEDLIVLNIRRNFDQGAVLFGDDLHESYNEIIKRFVEDGPTSLGRTTDDILENFDDLTDIEGFVVYLKTGVVFKLKTPWYLALHRSKEQVDTPRRLFEAAVYEGTDDLRSLFFDNPYVLEKIDEMDALARKTYHTVYDTVEGFVDTNKDLIKNDSRKDFALLAKDQLESYMMGLAMTRYDQERGMDKSVDYKEFLVKKWKLWGIKEDEPSTED